MKMRRFLLVLIAVALPMLVAAAEDTGKTEPTSSQTTSDIQNKTATGKDQVACTCGTTTTDLDRLIADMNGAISDKKLDAITAVVNKLVQALKDSQQRTETNTATDGKSEMGMCKMMMDMHMKDSGDNQEGDHEHHH